MRFRIWHVLLLTLLVGVALKSVSYLGTEYLELQVLDVADEGDTFSVMWSFQNCPLAEELRPRTFVSLQFASDGHFENIKCKPGDIIKLRYRVKALGPFEPEDPSMLVLSRLGLDHLKIIGT